MKKIISIIAGIIIALLIAIVIYIQSIDVNEYKDEIIALVETNTGRDFNITGNADFAISFIPTVVIEGISLGNADWGSAEQMLTVDRLELQVALLPLLSRTIQVNRLILVSPKVLLETSSEGEGNWVLATAGDQAAAEAAADPGELPDFSIDIISITNAHITYRDGITQKVSEVSLEEIAIDGAGINDPLDLTVTAAYNTVPVSINGTVGAPGALIDNSEFPLNLVVNLGPAEITLNGSINKPLQASGLDLQVTLNIDTLAGLSNLAESELPDIGPIAFTGSLADIDGGYALNDFTLNIANSDLGGNAAVVLSSEIPALQADVSSDLLDLVAISGEPDQVEQDTEKAPGARLFSAEPLPLESLHLVNASINVAVQRLHYASADLENTTLQLLLSNGVLTINPLKTSVAGGTLASSLTLDGSRRDTAALQLKVAASSIQPGLLPGLEGKMSDALTSLDLDVRGSGQSVAAIMAGLNGKLLLQTGAGIYNGDAGKTEKDGVFTQTMGFLKPKTDQPDGTQIQCMVINLDIKDGISAIDEKIGLETSKINVLGSGSLNFRTEELDIGVAPQAKSGVGISATQLAELVRLRGTFANPSVGTDTKAALKAGLSAGAAVATGGLSLLAQGLFNRTTADAQPCNTALGIKTASNTPARQPAPEQEAAAENPVESVTNKIKGLFGR